jgi:hypothetical protein
VSRGVRPLDGQHGHEPGSSFCFGVLVCADGTQRVCESAGGSTGPYSAYRYAFTDCLTGERVTLTGDRKKTPPVGEWRPITSRDRLKALTGLAPPTLRDGSILWEGAWWTKERRNPIMRGLTHFCMEEPVACTHYELRAILLNEDPESDWMHPRFNNTRDFAERVADTVDARQLGLIDAITQHYQRDAAMTERWCWRTGERGGRCTSWCERGAREVDLRRLADAGGLPVLLTNAEAAVAAAHEDIAREIAQARLDAAGGALQEHLFSPQPAARHKRAVVPVGASTQAVPASDPLALF